jgi:hypothetical protein
MPITINDCVCGQTPVVWFDDVSDDCFVINCPMSGCERERRLMTIDKPFLKAVNEWNKTNPVEGTNETNTI